MSAILTRWFSGDGFAQQGHIFPWTPELLWICLAAKVAIGVALYLFPLGLVRHVRRRSEFRSSRLLSALSAVLLAGGAAHFTGIWAFQQADHWLHAAASAAAAAGSLVTIVLLWRLVRKLMQLPSPQDQRRMIGQLEHEIEERKKAEDALRHSQSTLRELAAYQERIREDERKRIAREIHDELGQNLLALRLDVSALQARAGERHPLLRERSTAALDHIDTTMKAIRAIMNNLRPSVLDLGLPAAIEWQVQQFQRRNGVPCELSMGDESAEVPEAQAMAVFRILQESLNNIGRHARATRVRIELRIEPRQLLFSISDNGVGMFPGDRRKARRFGLIGIEERVTILGGKLHIDSVPGRGTMLRMHIPLPAETEQPLAEVS